MHFLLSLPMDLIPNFSANCPRTHILIKRPKFLWFLVKMTLRLSSRQGNNLTPQPNDANYKFPVLILLQKRVYLRRLSKFLLIYNYNLPYHSLEGCLGQLKSSSTLHIFEEFTEPIDKYKFWKEIELTIPPKNTSQNLGYLQD